MGNALVALLVKYLPSLVQGAKSVPDILEYLQKTREHLKQTKEWTPEEEAVFDAYLEEKTSQEHWKSRDQKGE